MQLIRGDLHGPTPYKSDFSVTVSLARIAANDIEFTMADTRSSFPQSRRSRRTPQPPPRFCQELLSRDGTIEFVEEDPRGIDQPGGLNRTDEQQRNRSMENKGLILYRGLKKRSERKNKKDFGMTCFGWKAMKPCKNRSDWVFLSPKVLLKNSEEGVTRFTRYLGIATAHDKNEAMFWNNIERWGIERSVSERTSPTSADSTTNPQSRTDKHSPPVAAMPTATENLFNMVAPQHKSGRGKGPNALRRRLLPCHSLVEFRPIWKTRLVAIPTEKRSNKKNRCAPRKKTSTLVTAILDTFEIGRSRQRADLLLTVVESLRIR